MPLDTPSSFMRQPVDPHRTRPLVAVCIAVSTLLGLACNNKERTPVRVVRDSADSAADGDTRSPADATDGSDADTTGDLDGSETDVFPLADGRPYPVDSSDVSFESGELELVGTLDRPDGAPTPVPGVVIVHGSGALDRTGEVTAQLGMRYPEPIAVYEEIARHLASRGFAVLRYDKRSCGPFNNCRDNGYPTPSPDLQPSHFAEDAASAVTALADKPDVADDEIYVIGHSQGAALAPSIVSSRPDTVRGAVLLAGTPADPADVFEYQYERSRKDCENSPRCSVEDNAKLSQLETIADNLAKLRDDEFDGSTIGGTSVTFWRDWFAISDELPETLEDLDQPLLSLSGDYDRNVPPRLARRWEPLFEAGDPRLDHRLVIQPCITHSMNCVTEPDFQMVGPDDVGRMVHDKVKSRLVDYLDRIHRSL